jgi:glycosyltransferase involved in cell wall biosynthesis
MENNKNVLMVVANYFNPDNRVFRAANTIQSMGYSVKLLALWKSGLSENEILGNGFSLKRVKTKSLIRIFSQLDNWQKLFFFRRATKKYSDQIRPNIVHCHDYNTLFLGIYCKKKFKSKVIYDCHEYFQDLAYLHRYPLIIRRLIARFEKTTIRKYVDKMVVVSPGIAELYQKFITSKIHIIRNIPDYLESDYDSTVPKDIKKFLDIQQLNERKLLLYLGTNTQKGRGMDFAFDLLKELPDEFGMVSFGATSLKEIDFLTEKALLKGISYRYSPFLSLSINQLRYISKYFYMGLSLIEPIYISYKFSLPNKFFEYLSMGLPVLSSEIPDQAEIIYKFNIGLVIPFDVRKSKEIILQSKGRIFNPNIKNLFSWDAEKLKFIALYNY